MWTDDDAAYLALTARDARFDGRLFVGVTSTGIYCRPICRVRTPRREHCRFFAQAAQAEAARFRPCLKCRPELAPGLSFADAAEALGQAAARLIDQAVHEGRPLTMPGLAAALGVTDRHLRRIFQRAHGVSPLAYWTTQRLLLAKQLLTDTPLPVTQVALASGYDSLRRFNAAFASQYRLNPTALRRAVPTTAGTTRHARSADATTPLHMLRLSYRPPYDHAGLLDFMGRRTITGVEQLVDGVYRRTLALTHRGVALQGWLEARFDLDRHQLLLGVSDGLVPALPALRALARQAFDLDAEPARIDPVLARRSADTAHAALAPFPAGLRLPGTLDGFELAVRVILGQQVTVAAARTLLARLVDAYGVPCPTPHPGLDRRFPDAATLAAADPERIGRLGIVRQRVRALQALAAGVADGSLRLQPGAPLAATLAALQALPGIGAWSAQLIALRALAWPDAYPATDIGLLRALGIDEPREATALAEAWRPWRGYALIGLWQQIERRAALPDRARGPARTDATPPVRRRPTAADEPALIPTPRP